MAVRKPIVLINGEKQQIPDTDSVPNADKLDGKDSTEFAGAIHNHTINDITNLQAELNNKSDTTHNHDTQYLGKTEKAADSDKLDGNDSTYFATAANLTSHTTDTNNPHNVTAAQLGAANILTQIKTVDGAGSGLDADLLDGNDSSFYRNASNINDGTLSNDRLSSQVYTQNNVVGTVSQSGGVPTGAIIERGSNANGEYVKFADGTMICNVIANKENFMAEATYSTTVQGIIWYRSGVFNWTFPVSFISTPLLEISVNTGVQGSRLAISRAWATSSTGTEIQLIGVEGFLKDSIENSPFIGKVTRNEVTIRYEYDSSLAEPHQSTNWDDYTFEVTEGEVPCPIIWKEEVDNV